MPPSIREPELLGTRVTGASAELQILVSPQLLWFAGHFPATPILPGVVQLDWALRYGRRLLPLGRRHPHSLQLKYRSPILPGMRLQLSLRLVELQQGERFQFEYRDSNELFSSGSLALAE